MTAVCPMPGRGSRMTDRWAAAVLPLVWAEPATRTVIWLDRVRPDAREPCSLTAAGALGGEDRCTVGPARYVGPVSGSEH